MKITNDEWKDIRGYEGLYKISSSGKIYNCKTKKYIKSTYINNSYIISLTKDKKRKKHHIARLVAEHFVDNPYNYKCIYFVDGNNKHISAYNIQWNNVNKNTKIVVDGIVFNSLKEYKQFCKMNKQNNYLMNLDNICELDISSRKTINAEFKI